MSDDRGLLRFLTAGSVDDGKSTLIGRLLHDARAIYQDQLAAVQAASNGAGLDFSLVTDGLRAEREQGITIDVAYRYFGTPRRKFIVADSPGHEQYTRNMATGASTASLAVLLMDAQKGATTQTYRHAAIASLMGIRSFVIAVNKMDLVDFREDAFQAIQAQFAGFIARLGSPVFEFIPCCAPAGDNVVERSARMPWYGGPALLEYLETTPIPVESNAARFRLPVQFVIRPAEGGRCYAGRISSGAVHTGDPIVALPSGAGARIAAIHVAGVPAGSAEAPLSASVQLDRELDLGRGDMLAAPADPPAALRRFTATLLWMSPQPLGIGRPYLVKHTSRYVCASVSRLVAAIDPVTLEHRAASGLGMNEFGEAEIETHQPLYIDPYAENRVTGSFIVVDPITSDTLAAGMIAAAPRPAAAASEAVSQGMAVWFTGLSSAGKSTISKAVYEKLWAKGYKLELLDGDAVRQHLTRDLGFSKQDRDENIRRIGFVAELLARNGVIVLVAAISPYREVREEVRNRVGNFVEVYVNAPLHVVEQRDLKGIYRRCRAGEIRGVTGIDDPYEPPLAPDVECRTDQETLAESVDKVVRAVETRIGAGSHLHTRMTGGKGQSLQGR
jgi:bifunctional enzyme CysN/CysC